jgi:hypothetical protein
VKQTSPARSRDDGQGVREAARNQIRPFDRIDRDVNLRPLTGSDVFADKKHGRLIALAFADHNGPDDVHIFECTPHGFHRGSVGAFVIALTHLAAGRQGSRFRDAQEFEREHCLNHGFSPVHWNQTSRGCDLGLVAALPVNVSELVAEPRQDGIVEGRDTDFGSADGGVMEMFANDRRDYGGPVGRLERKEGDAASP